MSAAAHEVAAALREIADAALGDPQGRWVVVQLVVDDDGAVLIPAALLEEMLVVAPEPASGEAGRAGDSAADVTDPVAVCRAAVGVGAE